MVAKITAGKSIRGVLYYNERKLTLGKAMLIDAVGFGSDGTDLNISQKDARFQLLTRLNKKVKTNAVHISLNFDRSDLLHPEKLQLIARRYMEGIGFGEQPYLVYQHMDAAHPHIHIVTTNMQESGKAISLHNIGKEKSEPTRKLIEGLFGLTVAESKRKTEPYLLQPVTLERIRYGEVDTKTAISNVVRTVARQYKFTSMEGFNAVLRQFGIEAYHGRPGSRIHDKKGIVYSILDESGRRTGVPIRASDIYSRPTLSNLQSRFERHRVAREPYRQRIITAVENIFARKNSPSTVADFQERLQRYGIYADMKLDTLGAITSITYVDNRTKAVFNGTELGDMLAAAGVQARIQASAADKQSPASWNERYVSQVLARTGRAGDIGELMAGWLAMGLVVRAESTPEGLTYLMGYKGIDTRYWKKADKRLTSYLRRCGYGSACSRHVADQLTKADWHPTFSYREQPADQVIGQMATLADSLLSLVLLLIREIFRVHAVKAGVPYHFYKSSKKQQRRL